MKRKILSVVLLLLLLVSVTIPALAASTAAESDHLSDGADLLTREEARALYTQLQRLSREYNTHIYIATVDTTGAMDISDYIEAYYDQNGFGYGDDRSGILLLVCMDIREFSILTNGAANDAIGSYEIDRISDRMVSDMSDGDYYAAFDTFLERCDYYLDGHINGFPFPFGQSLVLGLAIGLVAGLITAFALKAQLKTVRPQNRADAYVRPGSMQLTARSDLFLYRHLTRTKKESSNSSRGGGARSGSSRSVGGRRF